MTNSKYPTPVVPNTSSIYSNSISGKPVPQKRSETDGAPSSGGGGRNSSAKTRQNATSRSGSGNTENHQGNQQKKPKLPELKPTFSTFKQFHRTASLSDLINEDDTLVVKPEVIHKNTNIIKKSRKHNQNTSNQNHHKTTTSNRNIQIQELDTESLASSNVNIPDPILPPTKSITVQTDEALDLNLADFGISNRYVFEFLNFSFSPNLGNTISH